MLSDVETHRWEGACIVGCDTIPTMNPWWSTAEAKRICPSCATVYIHWLHLIRNRGTQKPALTPTASTELIEK